jgi:hypothetical protein
MTWGTKGRGKQGPREALDRRQPMGPIPEIPILEIRACKCVSVGAIGVSTQIPQSASQDLSNTLHNPPAAPAPDGRCQNGKKWNHGLPIHPSPRHYFP